MKRAAAAGLCAALLCGMCAPAYAADTAKPAQTTTTAQTEVKAPVKLSFDTLEKTVREGNVSIRSYQQTVESAEKTDVSDQYINKYFSLSQQIDAYDKQISSLKKSRDSIEDTDLRKTITAQISVLVALATAVCTLVSCLSNWLVTLLECTRVREDDALCLLNELDNLDSRSTK